MQIGEILFGPKRSPANANIEANKIDEDFKVLAREHEPKLKAQRVESESDSEAEPEPELANAEVLRLLVLLVSEIKSLRAEVAELRNAPRATGEVRVRAEG